MSSSSHPLLPAGTMPPCRHLKAPLGDITHVKHLLDEQAATYVLDHGYVEDVRYSNYKLLLGALGVLVTLGTHFYPLPFPANLPVLKIGVAAYFLVHVALMAIQFNMNKNCILMIKGRKKQDNDENNNSNDKSINKSSSNSPLESTAHMILCSTFPRYSTTYTLTLSSTPSPSSPPSSSAPAHSVSSNVDIQSVFDTNGTLLLEKYHAFLAGLLDSYEKKGSKKKA